MRAKRPFLRYRKAWSSIMIDDGSLGPRSTSGVQATRAPISTSFAPTPGRSATCVNRFGNEPWLGAALEEFVEKDLMLFLDDRYLSLALAGESRISS